MEEKYAEIAYKYTTRSRPEPIVKEDTIPTKCSEGSIRDGGTKGQRSDREAREIWSFAIGSGLDRVAYLGCLSIFRSKFPTPSIVYTVATHLSLTIKPACGKQHIIVARSGGWFGPHMTHSPSCQHLLTSTTELQAPEPPTGIQS